MKTADQPRISSQPPATKPPKRRTPRRSLIVALGLACNGVVVVGDVWSVGMSCSEYQWSPIAAAAANSQLAAVLAGFVFAGLVVLLSPQHASPVRIHVVSLFFAGFLVLSFASYLFVVITGDNGVTICRRAWTEFTVAGSLLSVGAVGMVHGICWLIAAYLGSKGDEVGRPSDRAGAQSLTHLTRLVRLALTGITALITFLMASGVFDYLTAWFDRNPPPWLIWPARLYTLFVLIVIVASAFERKGGTGFKAFFIGAYSSVAYAVLGTVFVGFLSFLHAESWVSPPNIAVIATTVVALILPTPSLIAFAYAVPPLPGAAGEELPDAPEQYVASVAGSEVPSRPEEVEADEAIRVE